MKFYRNLNRKLVCSSVALLVLAACGSSSSDPDGAVSQSALSLGPTAVALANGETLIAQHVAQVNRTFPAEGPSSPTLADGGESSLRLTDDTLVMTVNGEEFLFTEGDMEEFGFEVDAGEAGFYALFASDGPIEGLFDTNILKFANVFNVFTDDGNGNVQQQYVVVGTETELAQLSLLTGATYRGFMNADFFDQTNADFGESVRVRGEYTMTADFTASTISGESDGLRLREGFGAESEMLGTFFFDEGDIVGTSFGGTVSVDEDFLTATGVGDVDGVYEGSFFGAFANEAAGVMSGTTDGGYAMIGQFNGNAQTFPDD